MKLDLRSREITLPNGLVVRVRPLKVVEFQLLLGHLARAGDGELTSNVNLVRLATDREALETVQQVVEGAIVSHAPFTVAEDAGERPGVLIDLFLGAEGFTTLTLLLGQVISASTLTGTDAKN